MSRRAIEGLSAIGWLAFALAVLFASVRLGIGRPSDPGPGFIFCLSASLLALLAVTVLVVPPKRDELAAATGDNSSTSSILSAVTLLILYAWLFERIGFLVTTALMMATIVWLGGIRKWTRVAAFAVAATTGAYVLLHGWLGVRLP
jgi:hypothetical protein